MHIMSQKIRMFSSAIVGGCCSIAVGVGMSIKRKKGFEHVYCFVGDGATDQGAFWEAARYTDAHGLPVTFILEDNYMAVDTPATERFGTLDSCLLALRCFKRYSYPRKYPHCNTGTIVQEYM
jgi:pyruvate dehydrogenase E1 component alpha subunit